MSSAESINTKVNNLRKLIYKASANGTVTLVHNLQNLILKSNVKLFDINQKKICNYTSIFELIEYKTFKYLFTVFSIVSILISSYISKASSYAETQRNFLSLQVEIILSDTEEILKSSKSFREAIYKKSMNKMDKLKLFLETLEKLPYLYDTEDQDLNADTESCMAINNMENWKLEDNEESLLLINDTYSLNLEDISTCGTSKENSEENIQLTNAKQSKENETSESIDLKQDTQLIPNNFETPASNIDISDKKVIEQMEKSAFKATIDQQHKIVNVINHFIRNTRLDTSIDIIKTTAIAAGNEASNIQRGVWMHGIYGVNNQGLIDNIKGYTGISKGGSIGFDTKIENDIIGIVYSNVHSVLKFKNNRNKEVINSYIISIYGQKELPKNLVAQALISVSKNFIKDKITYSFNNAKFKSSLKHRNYTSNLEGVLNYNHLTKNNVIITPNIGLRYGKSRDGVYNETGISVQEISLTMKENNILSGIVGTKVKIPLKDILKFNNLGLTMHGSMEHNFNEKTQRVNMVIQISGDKFIQNYVIPKQPKTAYNLGASIMGDIKNTNIALEYNYYLNKHYQSHQGSIKFQINL